MAVARSKRMETVLKLVGDQEKQAALRLNQSRSSVENAESQLVELIEYEKEYLQAINSNRRPDNVQSMLNDRAFVGNLAQAKEVQHSRINQLKQDEQRSLEAWTLAHRKRKQIENLIENLKQGEAADVERKLQKLLDELTNINAHYRS